MAKTKLRLDLDHLNVESFATHPARDGVRGTIAGHSAIPTIPDTSTFDLGRSNLCTGGCPGGTLVCNEPVDPNAKYRLPVLK